MKPTFVINLITCIALVWLGISNPVVAGDPKPLYREFFVSPNGSDTNAGSKESPFKTLAKAKQAVREAIPGMNGDIVVTLAGGTYPVSQAIVFGPEDSSVGQYHIIYRAADGETPVLTAGVPITKWERASGGMWKAPLHRDHKLRALYVNDRRAVMAHSAEIAAQGGWGVYRVTAGQAPWAWESGATADGVEYNASDLPLITRNTSDVEIENRTAWNANFVGVRDISTEGGHYIFKLQQPYGAIIQNINWAGGLTNGTEQIVLNAYELLNQPGEFYFDRAGQTVYYVPRPGEDMTTAMVVAPVTETIIDLEGLPLKQRVRNLTFEGLTFADTDYNLLKVGDSVGKATVQTATVCTAFANPNWHLDIYRDYDTLPGAIMANAVEGIELIRSVIKHTGCDGVVMANDINDTKIIGNILCDCGGSAITLGHPQHVYENDTSDLKTPAGAGIEHEKFPAGTESAPRHVVIADNFLPDDAVLFNGHTVITVFFGEEIQIVHNWILNAPYSGINLGWGWCEFDGLKAGRHPQYAPREDRPAMLPGRPTQVARNNLVQANRVENTMLLLHDGGGIYTIGSQPGTVVADNYVHGSQQSIYTDEGSAYITCRDNVIASPFQNAHYAPDYGRKHSITIENYFVTESKWDVTAPDTFLKRYTLCEGGLWTLEAYALIKGSGIEPAYQDIVPSEWQPAPADRMLPASLAFQPGLVVPLNPLAGMEGNVWIAPENTTRFTRGSTMTSTSTEASSITAPMEPEKYRLYVVPNTGQTSVSRAIIAPAEAESGPKETVDFVYPDGVSEPSHLVLDQNSRVDVGALSKFYREGDDFAYRMTVPVDVPAKLVVTYFGEQIKPHKFKIYLGNDVLATETVYRNHPGQLFDKEYSIPMNAIQKIANGSGDPTVPVIIRFAVEPNGNAAGGVYGLRIVRRS